MQNKSDARVQFSIHPIEILFTSVIAFLLLLGLTNWDNIWKIALFGPIYLFSIGVFLQMFISEYKHRFSVGLDSFFSRILHVDISENGAKIARRIITAIIFSLAIFTSLISIMIIAHINDKESFWVIDPPSWFAIFMFISATLFGIVFGRIRAGKGISRSSSIRERWHQTEEEDRTKDFIEFKRWLKTSNSMINNSNVHYSRIQEQRVQFIRRIREILSSTPERKKIAQILQSESDKIEGIGKELRTEWTDWLRDTLEFFEAVGDKETISSLHSMLFLPVIPEILNDFIVDDSIPDETIGNLLNLLARFTRQLQYDEIVLPDEIGNSSTIEPQQSAEILCFIRKISISAMENPMYNWEPWWLLNIRAKMHVLMDSHQWSRLKSFRDRDEVDVVFRAVSSLLAKSRIESSKGVTRPSLFVNWIEEQIEMQDLPKIQGLSSFLGYLEDSAPSTASVVNSTLLKAWVLHEAIISREPNVNGD